MNRIVTDEYKGIKYSIQPHGLKSRFLTAFALFVVAFGGTLLAASPAQAAAVGPIPVTVCGNSVAWFVNDDEGDRAPLATSDGLVFSPRDLIHHAVDLPVSGLKPGAYSASPAPDQPSFFSVEVRSGKGAYGTLRWDGSLSQWSIIIGPDKSPPSGFSVTPGPYSNADPVALLNGLVTKWGPFDPATDKVVSFGVGYTNTPPGTVASLVSSIGFNGTTHNLSCPVAPSPSPVVIPQPIKTVIVVKTQIVPAAPVVKAAPSNTPSPDPSLVALPGPSPSLTNSPSLSPAYVPGDTKIPSPASAESKGGSLVGWGIVVAGVGGMILSTMGLAGVVKRRRQERYQGSHQADSSETQMMPAVPVDDYSVSDYDPKVGPLHDLSFPGDSNKGLDETVVQEIPSEILVRRDPFPGLSDNQ